MDCDKITSPHQLCHRLQRKIMPEVEKEATQASPQIQDQWILYTDGTSNASGSVLGLVLEVPTGEVIHQSIRYPDMTNNKAEYEVVIVGLRLALKYRARRVILRCDSQLVINQVTWTFQIKEQRLKKYQAKICKLLLEFDECRFDQIPRAQNNEADELAKLAIVTKRVTGKGNMVALYSSIGQIEEGILPDDKKEAKKLRIQLARILLAHYEKRGRGLRNKMRAMPKICPSDPPSRRATPFGHFPLAFYQMGDGHRRPPPYRMRSRSILSDTRAGSDHLYMEKHCVPFRPPQRDQLRQRTPTGKKVIEFFERWHIKKILSTPYHPAGNGQAESSNKSIQGIMKKKLENAKGLWPELLPEVLWAYRTIPMMSTGETPYLLVYGTDAVIPVEVGEPSLIYSHKSGPRNDESRMHDLDEADERRDMAYIRMVAQKQQAEHYYNKKAKIKPLKVGDYMPTKIYT
nr:uncharacterized protein LOC108947508 [Nicotiana tomentosiformis]